MSPWILAFGVLVSLCLTQAQKTLDEEDPNSLANSREADIAIVYHIGEDTKPREVKRVIAPMLISILDNADIDGGAVRVALVNFATSSSVIFSLNTYQRKTQVLDAMRRFISPRQRSRISDPSTAVKTLKSRIFQTVHGDRPNVPNLVILVTDTPSYVDGDYMAKVEELKNSGVYIFTIGLGTADRIELARVASQPSSLYSLFFSKIAKEDMILPVKTSLSRVVNALRANPSQPTQAPSDSSSDPCRADEMDLIFVIDSSTSVTEPNFVLIKDFLKFFLIPSDVDNDRVRVGIVIYSTRVKVQFQMSEYVGKKRELYKAIDRIPYSAGSTNTYGGLRTMRTKMFTPDTGDRPDVPNVCILITDGVSNIFSSKTIPEAELAKNEGIHIYVIGIGLKQKEEVSAIASKPLKDNLFTVDAFEDMVHLRELVFNSLQEGCGAPTVAPTPVYSDTGYDVIFMLDGSANNRYFGWMLGFAANFASQMSTDDGVWRVGAVTYSSGGPSLIFNLNRYGWKRDIVHAIQNDMNNNPGGRPDLGQAFQYVRSNMFTAANGDRPNAVNFVVVMTASDESSDQDATYAGAQALKDDLVGIYTVGINLGDTTELDTVTTKFLDEHQWLINQESEMSELPGMIIYNMEEADPVTRAPLTLAPTPSPTPGTSETGYDIIFMFDGTVNDEYFTWMRQTAMILASVINFDAGEFRIGAMTFTDQPEINFNLNDYQWQSDVVAALTNRTQNSPGGRPDLASAFDFVRTNMLTESSGDRPRAQNFVVLMTASEGSVDSEAARSASHALQRVGDSGTGIFSVGFNLDNTQELDAVTTKPLQDFRYLLSGTDGIARLPGFIGRVIYETKQVIIPEAPRSRAYSPTGKDIIFMFDGTANDKQFSWMKNLTKDFVLKNDIDSGEYRVGAMTYGGTPTLDFDLDEYGWQSDVVKGLTDKPQNSPGGRPDLAGAFDFVRTNMLTKTSGDRPRAQNFVVLMTASEESGDSEAARSASHALQRVGDSGTGIFSVGFNLDNTQELDSVTTKPLDQFKFIVNDEAGISVLPGRISNILPRVGVITLPQSTPATATQGIETTRAVIDGTGYDIILMFDGTVKNKHFTWMKILANNIANQLDIDSGDYKVGAVTFTDTPTKVFNLNEYDEQSEIANAIDSNLENSPGGRPDLAGAFDFVRTNMLTESSGDRPRAQNFVVLMTASEESMDSEAARSASEALQRVGESGTGIFSVGFNLDNTHELDAVTTKPLDQFQFLVNGRPGLRKIPGIMKPVIMSDPVISVPDPAPVSPTMKHRAYSPTGKDIVFMFDGTANDEHFSWMKNLTKDFVSENDIDSGEFRVGAMTYGDTPTLDFDLDEYGWQSDVVRGITDKPQNRPGGRPDLAGAFDFVRTNMLTKSSGDRPRAQNFVVLMTASEESGDSEAARSASHALQRVGDSGTGIFSVGFNLDNTEELDGVTTKPLDQFQFLVNGRSGVRQIPGMLKTVIASDPGISVPDPVPVSPTMRHRAYSPTGKDIVFMFDGTANDEHFSWMKNLTKDFVSKNDIDSGEYRVGAMTYGDTPILDFDLDEYGWQSDVVTGITDKPQNSPGGRPDLARAFDFVRTNMLTKSSGDRPRAQNFVVLMTASEESGDSEAARSASKSLQRVGDSGTGIFSVGFNLDNTQELDAVTTKPLDQFQFLVNGRSGLRRIPGRLKTVIKSDPGISVPVPDPVPVSPTMRHRAYSPTGKDIVFMFDGTANDEHFSWMKNLTKDFVSKNDIDSGEYRVGAMTYGDTPNLDFDLDEYGWQSDVVTGITDKPQNSPGGRPDLARAFDFVRTNMLTESSGDRPRAQNFVVLMTASEKSVDSEAARSASKALQRVGDYGTRIFSVGFNLDNTQELDDITTKPLQDFRYLVNTLSGLAYVPESIGTVISKPKSSPSIQVTSPDWEGKCGGSDVIFMLDGTVDPQKYRLFKHFAKNFTQTMNPNRGSDEFRVGGMAFTQSPSKGFHLSDTDPIVSLDVLDSFNRPGGTPNLAQAIDIVSICMFTAENGDRPRADNYMVILTGSDACLSLSRAAGAAKRFQETGGRIFTVGVNLSNTSHLEAITSKPLDAYQYLVSSEADFGILPMAMKATMRKPPHMTSSSDYPVQQVQHAASPRYTMTNRKEPIVVSLNLNFTLNNAP